MTMSDPISDMLTRIRNGQRSRKHVVEMPSSKMKVAVAKILKEEGYLESVEVVQEEGGFPTLKLGLRYHANRPVIEEIHRSSRPGCRKYVAKDAIPRVYQGLGIAVLSTSQGMMSSRKARKLGVGGELICTVF
ncbi:MAG: 30S ribosomal protein S8 [Magnetococcales bacterium]|nr:30S ribosomal protein S8 [Magnetococcales bacterium]NGZ27516.1 30S ribosomal protein S8 [Magnetococcales bacterium]